MADFGTCAIGWPLLDEWEADVIAGRMPQFEKRETRDERREPKKSRSSRSERHGT
jgi:hypothetical protein